MDVMTSYTHQNYEHRKLLERLAYLDTPPEDADGYAAWVTASRHLDFLRKNTDAGELIIYACGRHTLVNTLIVPEEQLSLLSQNELYDCSVHGSLRARFTESNEKGVQISAEKIDGAHHLVFERGTRWVAGQYNSYYEILQEYCHLTEIHWREELHAYCRVNESGDVEYAASVTSNPDEYTAEMISFVREPLEEYLVVSNCVLVRAFEFFFARNEHLPVENEIDYSEQEFQENGTLFYAYGNGRGISRTHGIQIIRPDRSIDDIENESPVNFKAWDYRYDPPWNRSQSTALPPCKEVPADPSEIVARTSSAFFTPGVLLKYKNDNEKYQVTGSRINSRGGWSLRYHINEANQVHTLVYYLTQIPIQEQHHWKSYNECPKTGVSEGTYQTAIEGIPNEFSDPLLSVKRILQQWTEFGYLWWRHKVQLENINMPLTGSWNEWLQSVSELSKLIIEGFVIDQLLVFADTCGIKVRHKRDRLLIIEQILVSQGNLNGGQHLEGLRKVKEIRDKGGLMHATMNEGIRLANEALKVYGTYTAHFESVCRSVLSELEAIESCLTA